MSKNGNFSEVGAAMEAEIAGVCVPTGSLRSNPLQMLQCSHRQSTNQSNPEY